MGTNFYATTEQPCPHCGRGGELKHIGKSSAGWVFALHIYPDEGINTLKDWQEFWKDKRITDEYGTVLSQNEMLSKITERGREEKWDKTPYGYSSWDDFHRMNQSEKGPKGLLRSKIDGRHCIGHGDGTYDYHVGEFS